MRDRARGGSRNAGFGIVEAVVTLLVFSVALLGLSAAAALVALHAQAAHAMTRAATISQSRLEQIMAAGFDRLADGERSEDRLRVRWRVSGGRLRQIQLMVSYELGRVTVTDTVATMLGGL